MNSDENDANIVITSYVIKIVLLFCCFVLLFFGFGFGKKIMWIGTGVLHYSCSKQKLREKG
jgi:hypothetical protein